ncbi:glycoside hydrolase [Coprinopsis marcescibilis]|uniref:Glycoside hydrolase n=1 Tax=Coprinopsis marcescibilis TaxID=230819 RepID=A0A5C3L935_COPMA|nr:glycoside hydrolase [Coprinopsis marcescibilis]
MPSTTTVSISGHTTASNPRPHILYTVKVNDNGNEIISHRRYSEFVTLFNVLKAPFQLPPKRLLVTYFIPSAWVDDALIAERKAGLAEFLNNLLSSDEYKNHSSLSQFLHGEETVEIPGRHNFDLEDALPSTLPRKAALNLAASRPTAAAIAAFANQASATSTNSDEVARVASTMISAAYYPGWSSGSNPPENLNFSKFDILFYAFVMPNSSSGINWDGGDKDVLRRLVAAARKSGYGTKIVLSVGGWSGCYWFSQACSTSSNRTKLHNALMEVVNTYGLDGIDLDWEYPNSPGAGNPYSANDSANYLTFMKLLRNSLGPCKIVSSAVAHLPWLGSNGKPLASVTDFASVMDYICIMNYDVWGSSGTPGPNAPLGNLCGTSKQPHASAQAALAQWKAAGFPASKQLLGLALYGWVSQSSKTVLNGAFMPSDNMVLLTKTEATPSDGKGDITFLNGAHPRAKDGSIAQSASVNTSTAEGDGEGEIVVQAADLRKWWGQQIPFKTLVSSGALVKKSDGTYGQGSGFTMGWDNCSNTPFLFNTSQQTVISYDDTWSLTDKAKFARDSGMAGCFTWSLDQDDGLTLQNAIRKALGK